MKTNYIDHKVEIIRTEDGSNSLFNSELNETYHSRTGAIKESEYVYIANGIDFYLQSTKNNNIQIFELGFGTGSNLLLTLNYALKNPEIQFNYITVEKYPLSPELVFELNYIQYSENNSYELFQKAHQASWNEKIELLNNFYFTKINNDINQIDYPKNNHVIYYDAFAPSKQSDVWDIKILENMYNSLEDKGIIVTYCSQGAFKRNLKKIGFLIEEIPSFPYKKEIVRAQKSN
ncbi:MAG: tRNA (5-methylaminomethyl-2-thiouridine)(34)-methyltransferase MnmD [Cytophagales bacterium]